MENMGDEQLQANISDLRERVARVEVKTEGVESALRRFDAHLGVMAIKIDEMAEKLAQGIGAAKLGFWVGRGIAAIGGFAAAHFWSVWRN